MTEYALASALLNGTYGNGEEVLVPTLEEFVPEFLEGYVASNNKLSEQTTKKRTFERHLCPFFGRMRLNEIRPRHIERYKALKLKKLKKKTINNHLVCLRKTLAIAAEWEIIDAVPRFRAFKREPVPFDFLDFDEAARLEEAADGQWRLLIVVALNTGLRMGELLALRWEDADLVAGRIVVRQSDWKGHIVTPKSGRWREIPLNAKVLKALKKHRHLRGPLVFCEEDGTALTYKQMHRGLMLACKLAGLRLVQWHCLRHSFASHMVMRGVTLKAVRELLGHASIEMTMRYAHLSPDVRRDAVDALLEPERQRHNDGTWSVSKKMSNE